MDPFDPHSIARSNAERTLSQRQQREGEWLMRLNPHMSNDQLRSWTDVAEELLTQGFEGNYGQTQRMARAVRAACLEHRYLTFAPQSSQLHEEPRTTAEQPRQQAEHSEEHADEPRQQAEESEEHAEEPQSTVDGPHGRAQQSPEHVQQSPEHAEEPQATVEEPRQQAEQSQEHADEPQTEVRHSQQDLQQSHDVRNSDDDDHEGIPILDFIHGTKRRRQVPSESEESGSTTPKNTDKVSSVALQSALPAAAGVPIRGSVASVAMTPANPIPTTAVPSQGTVAPIITFGSAAPTTLIVSNKAVNRLTANDYAGTTSGMVYSCPVNGCEQAINEAWTTEKFYKHLDDALHTDYFYQQNTHVCPVGCQKGF
ncbi:hypothetical protein KCU79_g3922, partial [Aureobasidium melanogenum]